MTGALAACGAALLLLGPARPPGPSSASGQQPSNLTLELSRALERAGAAERIPVLIEMPRLPVPEPLAPDKAGRAAQYAGNLADRYAAASEGLRRLMSAEGVADPQIGDLIWIGGAVTARLTPDQVRALEGRPEARRVYYDGLVQVELSAPRDAALFTWSPGLPLQDPAGGLPWGLEAIGAPEVWGAGATGEGTVIASIDSGVDGTHPLLWRKWRGLATAPEFAWFDPWGISTTPVDDEGLAGVGHGTIVMSTALGSLEPGDTLISLLGSEVVQGELEVVTGVAPGAEWVAANAFEGFGGESYTRLSVLLQSMQWVVDPDGDPATVTDVPDVVNNSWGFRSDGCNGIFDRAIDALELAGIPVVFAAGNRSSGIDTVATPGQRADLLLNAFAVGAVERRDGEIILSPNSAGGPSPCSPDAVKPEVVAPGEVPVVRNVGPHTAEVRGRSGPFTSWAAPHVSGALAVLRGLNPSATSDELKGALYSTAVDLPPAGPDNGSGAGLIDLVAAAQSIGGLGGVLMAVAGWTWDEAGGDLTLKLYNAGSEPFLGGNATLQRAADRSTLASATAPPVGPRARADIVFADLASAAVVGERLRLRLESGGAALNYTISLSAPSASAVTLTAGDVAVSIDGNGRLGNVAGTPGFEFIGGDWLPGGGFLFEAGARVSDAAYVDVLQQPALKGNRVGSDTDWRTLGFQQPAAGEAALTFSDDRALYPLGARVSQSARLTSIADSAAFILLTSVVQHHAGRDVLGGLFLDWDFAGRDSVAWDDGLGASLMTSADSVSPWMALTALPAPATHAAVPLGSAAGQYYAAGSGVLSTFEGFSDLEKSRLMRLGGAPVSTANVSDWGQLVTVGPVTSGEATVFIIAAGRSRRALRAALDSARAVAEVDPPLPPGARPVTVQRPSSLELPPAYPNPYDPFDGGVVNLPFLVDRGSEAVRATLKVYTIAGIQVYEERRLLQADVPLQPFTWDGRLVNGDLAAAGVYGYVIRVGEQRRTGKFVLRK